MRARPYFNWIMRAYRHIFAMAATTFCDCGWAFRDGSFARRRAQVPGLGFDREGISPGVRFFTVFPSLDRLKQRRAEPELGGVSY
jgi:hypothetical protein